MISPNYDERQAEIDMLLLHYTGMKSCDEARARLCDERSKVSAHYLIDEDGALYELVSEDKRAWHAGAAFWQGETDINSCSIGIEISNGGHDFGLPDFPDMQMKSVVSLCADLVIKYRISPERVLAHSDVAPARKQDPGEKFDWAMLAREGVGLWIDKQPPPDENIMSGEQFLKDLAAYGYQTEGVGAEEVVRAFQRHYRPARLDGRVDGSTSSVLAALTGAKGASNL